MIVRPLILLILVMGMILGHESTDNQADLNEIDNLWKEYEHEEGFEIPESIMKGLMFIVSKIVFIGFTLSIWAYPYGLILGIIIFIISLINFQWLLYPFLFVYVFYDERKTKHQN